MRITHFILGFLILFFAIGLWAANLDDNQSENDGIHTPDYYAQNVRMAFKQGHWEDGKRLLDVGLEKYPNESNLNMLAGSYFYHKRSYDDSRYYLVRSVRADQENVEAKQLLVNVEDSTHNYSSAICYVNELLELNPYWKGLWRKKIQLFRKQGNIEEADRLLHRFCKIYPNDSTMRRDQGGYLEEDYLQAKNKGDKREIINTLTELVRFNTDNEEYYLALSNQLLQEGKESEAIEVAERGVSNLPQSSALAIKKASILAGQARYPEALTFIEACMKKNRNGRLSTFYNQLSLEAARAEAKRDPYVLYGKVYETQKSQEALDYLLSTSITRGYYEDALFYIDEARKREGETPALLYKSYIVNKRMGNERAANNLLSRLYERTPNNTDVADELARLRLEQGTRYMEDDSFTEALGYLQFAADHAVDPELIETAYSRMVTCYIGMHRYSEADETLEALHNRFPDRSNYVEKKANLMQLRNHKKDALDFLYDTAQNTTDELDRLTVISAYEEIAVPYIKSLTELGATAKAYSESERLLQLVPSSELGLHYAVNTSAKLRHWDEFDNHVAAGRKYYPDSHFYLIKQASIYQRQKDYTGALQLLRPELDEYMGDTLLVNAFSESSCEWANALIKKHEPDSALVVVDSALVFNPENWDLLYTKGLAYEALHQFDSAYVYQRYYKPSFLEASEYKQHLNSLLSRSYPNTIRVEYLQSRYGDEDVLTSVATIEYSRKLKDQKNTITGRVNYAGRDGDINGSYATTQVPGGTGFQIQGEWEHQFNQKWTGMINAAWANKYLPELMANVKLTRTFKNEWELEGHAGYRRINMYKKNFAFDSSTNEWTFDSWDKQNQNLFNAGVGAAKTLNNFWVNAKVDGYWLNKKLYFNASAQGKYFPLSDGRTCIQAIAGIGTAPEAAVLDYAMPNSFEHMNTMVGLGAQYQIHPHVTLGVQGEWHTFYSQTDSRTGTQTNYTDFINSTYKNLFNVDFQVLISF